LGGILYARAKTYLGRSKGANECRIAIVIGNKSTAQRSLLVPRQESMCVRWGNICERWRNI